MARTASQVWPAVLASPARRSPGLIAGTVTIGSSGAITATTGFFASESAGIWGVVKTASKTGRYTFTFDRNYRTNVVPIACGIVGPADAAFGNTSANSAEFRNVSKSSCDIQLMLASTGADTDAASGYVLTYLFYVERQGGKD